jgi:hypothetical protein
MHRRLPGATNSRMPEQATGNRQPATGNELPDRNYGHSSTVDATKRLSAEIPYLISDHCLLPVARCLLPVADSEFCRIGERA